MDKETIYYKIRRRKNDISHPYQIDEGYEFCRKFLEDNHSNASNNYKNMDLWTCLKCIYYIENKGRISLNRACRTIDSFKDFISSLNSTSLDYFFKLIKIVRTCDKLDEIIAYFREKNIIIEQLLIRKIFDIDKEVLDMMVEFKKFSKTSGGDVSKLIELYRNEPDFFENMIEFVKGHKKLSGDGNLDDPENNRLCYKVKNKDKLNYLDLYVREKNYMGFINNIISEICTFVREIDNEKSQYEKNTKKEQDGLQEAWRLLCLGLDQDEITNAREIQRLILDSDIKLSILQLIYDHNMLYYKNLDDEVERISKNKRVQYQNLLCKYNISVENYNIEDVMNHSLSDLEDMIVMSMRLHLFENQIMTVLRTSSVHIVKTIINYVEDGYLSLSYLRSNIDIFSSESNKLNIFSKNINLLRDKNVNAHLFFDSCYLLFYEGRCLEDNLDILDNYDLLKYLKTTCNYDFLIDNNLVAKIDKILELGYEDFLLADLGLLNNNNIKRLEVLKAMNIPVDTKDELDGVIGNDKKFIIKDDVLDYYIPNIVSYMEKVNLNNSCEFIEQFRVSDRLYSFGGTLVSSNKVKRLLDNGFDLYDSIFFNMSLSDEEYNSILSVLKPIQYMNN